MKLSPTKIMQHTEPIQVLVRGAMAVFYFGNLIALVNDKGEIIWRDKHLPIFLVEYLIEYAMPQSKWN